MKVVVIYLDQDGYEAYKEEYEWPIVPDEYMSVISDMIMSKVRVRQIGEKIIEIV